MVPTMASDRPHRSGAQANPLVKNRIERRRRGERRTERGSRDMHAESLRERRRDVTRAAHAITRRGRGRVNRRASGREGCRLITRLTAGTMGYFARLLPLGFHGCRPATGRLGTLRPDCPELRRWDERRSRDLSEARGHEHRGRVDRWSGKGDDRLGWCGHGARLASAREPVPRVLAVADRRLRRLATRSVRFSHRCVRRRNQHHVGSAGHAGAAAE